MNDDDSSSYCGGSSSTRESKCELLEEALYPWSARRRARLGHKGEAANGSAQICYLLVVGSNTRSLGRGWVQQLERQLRQQHLELPKKQLQKQRHASGAAAR